MKKWVIGLILIFFLALFLRLFAISKVPNGLHQDELNAGYQGYEILHTERDLQGNFLPLYINRFGDYRAGGIFYVDGISTSLFGLNTFAIRLPSSLLGALTIFAVFALTYVISKKKSLSLITALLIAISPWHIVVSRATSEQVVALLFIIIGMTMLLLGIERQKKKWIAIAAANFLLSYFFYPTPRVFIPAFLTLLVILTMSRLPFQALTRMKTIKGTMIILWAVMVVITIGITLTPFGRGRFNQTSIFADPQVKAKIQSLENGDDSILTARIFHNKLVIYTQVFLNQYITYFSTDFLYIRGGLPDRYVVPDSGLFYYIEFPFLLLGFYFLIRRKDLFFLIPILWILLGPLAASLTTEDSPNVERALFMLPAFQIIEAYGIYYLSIMLSKKWKTVGIVLGSILIIGNMAYFLNQYFVHAKSYVAYRRDDGEQSLFTTLHAKENQYDMFYLPTAEDIPLYFYYFNASSVNLAHYTQKNLNKGFQVGKYVFVPDICPQRIIPKSTLVKQKALLVDFSDPACHHDEEEYPTIQTITRQDGTTAYLLKVIQ